MRIAICEDELNMQTRLKESIVDWAESRKIKADILCYPSAEAFLMTWPEVSFDLAFLDIQMKQMTGIELANCIRKTDSDMLIVFITSFSQYVLKGYDVNALHYLIKPLSPAKLLPVLDKALMIWRSRQDAFLLVPDRSGLRKLPFSDIYYISIQSHTSSIHTNDTTYEIRKTIKELVEIMPSCFVRIHRSFIVNLFKVDCMYKDSLLISNDIKLPISRNYSKEAKDAFLRLHMGR